MTCEKTTSVAASPARRLVEQAARGTDEPLEPLALDAAARVEREHHVQRQFLERRGDDVLRYAVVAQREVTRTRGQ